MPTRYRKQREKNRERDRLKRARLAETKTLINHDNSSTHGICTCTLQCEHHRTYTTPPIKRKSSDLRRADMPSDKTGTLLMAVENHSNPQLKFHMNVVKTEPPEVSSDHHGNRTFAGTETNCRLCQTLELSRLDNDCHPTPLLNETCPPSVGRCYNSTNAQTCLALGNAGPFERQCARITKDTVQTKLNPAAEFQLENLSGSDVQGWSSATITDATPINSYPTAEVKVENPSGSADRNLPCTISTKSTCESSNLPHASPVYTPPIRSRYNPTRKAHNTLRFQMDTDGTRPGETKPEASRRTKHKRFGPGTKHSCATCGQIFGWRERLVNHLIKIHGVGDPSQIFPSPKRRFCQLCTKSFHPNRLKHHLVSCHRISELSHLSKQGFCTCQVCFKTFATARCYRHHMYKVHGVGDPADMFLTRKANVCTRCEKTFSCPSRLRHHLYKVHEVGDSSNLIVIEKKHACTRCGKTFSKPKRLRHHLFAAHSEGDPSNFIPCTKPYFCTECPQTFHKKMYLTVHLFKAHGKGNPENFSFSWKTELPMQRTMPLKKPHQCEFCGKIFQRISSLTIHIRTHTGEKPFMCKLCGKTFTSPRCLKIHEEAHSKEKHPCSLCGKSFKSPKSLQNHMTSHSEERHYQCKICKKSFKTSQTLRRHTKRHVNDVDTDSDDSEGIYSEVSTDGDEEAMDTGRDTGGGDKSGDTGTDTDGGDKSLDNGTNTGGDKGRDTGTDTGGGGKGRDTGTDTDGGDRNRDTGIDTDGGDKGRDTGTDTGVGDKSRDTGTDTDGGDEGRDTGTDTDGGDKGLDNGTDTGGGDKGRDTGTDTGGGGKGRDTGTDTDGGDRNRDTGTGIDTRGGDKGRDTNTDTVGGDKAMDIGTDIC